MLQVCLNGSRRPHERVPTTVTEIAESAAEAVAAGAQSIHVHPRGDRGRETLDPDLVALTVEAIRRAAPGIPVGVTTHERIVPDGMQRLALVSRWPHPEDGGPDFASVNWHEAGAYDLATTLRTRRIEVEAGLWSPGAAADFIGRRWLWQVLRVLIEAVPGHSPGGYGTWAAERILSALGSQPAPILVHGEDRWAWPVLRWAQREGFDTRIGLEDTLFDEAGLRARGNGALIREAVTGHTVR
ncbi:MAG TPA: 3-keto-5-aminohexanoate cleavage protein [Lapillicoccus sp.]|nr:3-keto-5-aminohexanoate cleavage protein [Lapillicoccus sp.]